MLEFKNIFRSYDGRKVLSDVSFAVPRGCLTGFVGANGAGKTTTMRVGIGVLAADSGSVEWDGSPITGAQQQRFGYMPEERGLYPKQVIRDQLVFFGRIHGMSKTDALGRADHYLDHFGLTDRSKEKLESLSLGNQQRVQIIAALIHDPICLILDEPFSGLDPVAVDSMGTLLKGIANDGVPVLFSSHQLDLVERLCDELVILADGEVQVAGNAEELRRRGRPLYRLETSQELRWLEDMHQVTVVSRSPGMIEFHLSEDGLQKEVLSSSVERGDVSGFSRVTPTLSDIFMDAVR